MQDPQSGAMVRNEPETDIDAAPAVSLFIKRATIAKIADTFAPSAIAAGLKGVSHQCFHLFLSQPVFTLYIVEANVIGEAPFR